MSNCKNKLFSQTCIAEAHLCNTCHLRSYRQRAQSFSLKFYIAKKELRLCLYRLTRISWIEYSAEYNESLCSFKEKRITFACEKIIVCGISFFFVFYSSYCTAIFNIIPNYPRIGIYLSSFVFC